MGAVSNLLLAPFTKLFIGGINGIMIAANSGTGRPLTLEAARELIGKWGEVNAVRILMPLGGAVLGLWNILQ